MFEYKAIVKFPTYTIQCIVWVANENEARKRIKKRLTHGEILSISKNNEV